MIDTPKGLLQAYASGDGALHFSYGRRVQSGERIGGAAPGDIISIGSPRTVEELAPHRDTLIPPGWVLAVIEGSAVAFQPVEREGPQALLIRGVFEERYTYDITYRGEGWNRYRFYHDNGATVVNYNTIGVLSYFLEHEETINALTLDYAI